MLRAYRGQLFGGQPRCFLFSGRILGADASPDPFGGPGKSQMPLQRFFEDLVFALT